MTFEDAFAECPIISILRGIRPNETASVCDALYAAGIRIVEVAMNSPEPLDSIRIAARTVGTKMVVGAGTVLNPQWLDGIMDAGGRIAIAPNTDPAVIRRAVELDMTPMPGFSTPTEAFAAYSVGARYLKLFPAASLGPPYFAALAAVLPRDACVLAVGGVGPGNMREWLNVGVRGFGIGSEIYKPGRMPEDVGRAALSIVNAFKSA